jgi:hypothetical protein
MKLRKMQQLVLPPFTTTNIDVVGILKDVGEPSEITSKTTQKAVSPIKFA